MMHISFSRDGWRQFEKLNRVLGTRYIKAFLLRLELDAFLQAHADSSHRLDTICQELHYHSGIYLLIKCVSGEWVITDIWQDEAPADFLPIFVWQRIKLGIVYLAAKVLVGWRSLSKEMKPYMAYQ